MNQKKDLSLVNCLGTGLLAIFLSIPVHEFIHLVTFYAFGDKCEYYAATSVNYLNMIDYTALPPFQRILATGGSASILNAIIGIVLLIILLKVKMGSSVFNK